ncbi:MAG: hypothetical protein D5R98_10275 [Desulfonatronovibrio sp. MSAO_Bac4]|nr:MAG: hypothetical protein D5R98_10275 [Desulfonatronovibrio sp. MSAO_Bac4]
MFAPGKIVIKKAARLTACGLKRYVHANSINKINLLCLRPKLFSRPPPDQSIPLEKFHKYFFWHHKNLIWQQNVCQGFLRHLRCFALEKRRVCISIITVHHILVPLLGGHPAILQA